MALFGRKKKEENVKVAETKVETTANSAKVVSTKQKPSLKAVKIGVGVNEDIARVLISPRITEKATENAEKGVYVFNVASNANKKQIEKAIRILYKVEPRKISVSKIQIKKVRNSRTGIIGVKGGGKKAYVYLKEGDTISVM
jgi:large subunit ribosomal protein L23